MLVVINAFKEIKEKGNDNSALVKSTNYYFSCLDKDRSLGLSPYWQALQAIEGAPLADRMWWHHHRSSWNDALLKLHLNYSVYRFFKVLVSPNLKNPSEHIFEVNFADWGLLTKVVKKDMFAFDIIFDSGNTDPKETEATLEQLVKSFVGSVQYPFVAAAARQSRQHRWYVQLQVSDALMLERRILSLLKHAYFYLGAANTHTIYETSAVKELNTLMYGVFHWKKFLNGLVKGTSKTPISDNTVVGLMVPKRFLTAVAYRVYYFPKSVLANYFAWTRRRNFHLHSLKSTSTPIITLKINTVGWHVCWTQKKTCLSLLV